MGADLYIYDEKGNEVAYFRDSYNMWNVLWRLNGSYWEMANNLETDKEKIEYLKSKLEMLNYKKEEWKELFKEKHYVYFCREADKLKEWVELAEKCLNKKGYKIGWCV